MGGSPEPRSVKQAGRRATAHPPRQLGGLWGRGGYALEVGLPPWRGTSPCPRQPVAAPSRCPGWTGQAALPGAGSRSGVPQIPHPPRPSPRSSRLPRPPASPRAAGLGGGRGDRGAWRPEPLQSPRPASTPCLTKCKHLVPVSAEAAPGPGHQAVKPAGHRHGQQRGHKHGPHGADEGVGVGGHLGLQAAQAGTQEHGGCAWAGGGAVRARGDPAGASDAGPVPGPTF